MRESLKKHGFTMVDHVTFDLILPTLSPSAQSIFLRIYRQTVGWKKEMDRISYSQFRKMTGISSNGTIAIALNELRKKKLIKCDLGRGKICSYGINWNTIIQQMQVLQKS